MKTLYYTVSKVNFLFNGIPVGCGVSIREGWGGSPADSGSSVQMGKACVSRPDLVQKEKWYPVFRDEGPGKIRFSSDSYVLMPAGQKKSAAVFDSEGA